MFNDYGPIPIANTRIKLVPRPTEETKETTGSRVFGDRLEVPKPTIRLKHTMGIFSDGMLPLDPISKPVEGELPYQNCLPKEQRSNLTFDDHGGPEFHQTQKKKISHKKITRPGRGGSTFIFG
ncbi:hypothetical protein HDV03_000154 [Kappamyces sp. JEL0829]|nr:hypothetical protein HDV03_000154 [Kappamyces sp. JEL0829]